MKDEIAIFIFGLILGALLCLIAAKVSGLFDSVKIEVTEHMIGE